MAHPQWVMISQLVCLLTGRKLIQRLWLDNNVSGGPASLGALSLPWAVNHFSIPTVMWDKCFPRHQQQLTIKSTRLLRRSETLLRCKVWTHPNQCPVVWLEFIEFFLKFVVSPRRDGLWRGADRRADSDLLAQLWAAGCWERRRKDGWSQAERPRVQAED